VVAQQTPQPLIWQNSWQQLVPEQTRVPSDAVCTTQSTVSPQLSGSGTHAASGPLGAGTAALVEQPAPSQQPAASVSTRMVIRTLWF
jgi:hypothetical protein